MGWELRKNGHFYYTKERGADGKPRSKYIGKGEIARLISQCERGRRIEREVNKEIDLKKRIEIEKLDLDVNEMQSRIDELVNSVLIQKGFYKTKSREWRYRKNGK
jgi:hypothetical protein